MDYAKNTSVSVAKSKEDIEAVLQKAGATVSDNVRPQIATAYQTGKMPKLLPGV